MVTGYLALVISYTLVSTLLLCFFINLKGWLILKMIITAFVVWYAIAIFLLVPNLLGWPVAIQEPPDKSRLASYVIDEPRRGGSKGAIYLWVLTKPDSLEPRAFVIPYSRKKHKQLIELDRRTKGQASYIQILKSQEKSGFSDQIGEKSKAKLQFRIINPIDMFPKESQ